MTQHLLVALQPRRLRATHLVGMGPSHLGCDSTAESCQGAIVAIRYPLFIQRKVSPPPTIQINKEGEGRLLLLTINTTKPAIVAYENYTLSATLSLLATFILLLRQPLGCLPSPSACSLSFVMLQARRAQATLALGCIMVASAPSTPYTPALPPPI